jgi:hypothetical protein
MRYGAIGVLLALFFVASLLPAPRAAEPANKTEELAEKVRKAIDRGVKYLRDLEEGRGDLEKSFVPARAVPGGLTALGVLALLNAGVPPDDPIIQRGLTYLRSLDPNQGGSTYVVGLQTMVFAAAGQNEDKERIQRNVDWLIAARMMSGKDLLGWTYTKERGIPDNSNTQYALLGLHEGYLAGAKIDSEVWESIRDYYIRTQFQNGDSRGGWCYRPVQQGGQGATLTMTTAGLCGLLIADMDLKSSKRKGEVDCDKDCGDDQEDEHIARALEWVGKHLPRTAGQVGALEHLYYSLYGIERTGRFTGQRFLGENDWYRLGCEYLVEHQNKENGSWGGGGLDGAPVIATSFALLFLSKGRTPVLMSKLVHDPETDWNNHRSDARNLVNFASAELFKRQPLAWQVFDARRVGDLTRDRIEHLTAELLQSPIAYISGKAPPRFKEGEEEILKEYIANGGFLFAEACCGQPGFDKGFKDLMARLFPDTPMKKLAADHPVYFASGKWGVSAEKWPLWGMEMGCKTVVVYSPRGLSCWWEANQSDRGKCQEAFRLGANVIAYATGMEPPRPRLTEVQVVNEKGEKKVPRGFLKVAQVRHDGDWHPAPHAMPNLMGEMRKSGLDVALQTEEMRLTYENLIDFRFLYMHGRNAFALRDDEIKKLRFNLETGGLLFADACCGSKAFDQAFRQLVKALWPDKPLEAIPLNDDLFGPELNGTGITTVRCRREGPDGKKAETEFRNVPPQLEGVKINGRWVIIYSKYDIGCALERRQATDCLGHDHDSAVLLGKAAVLYAMRR